MHNAELNVVTGAFGFTGAAIARRLLADRKQVLTLTGHPKRHHELAGRVDVARFNFDNPAELARSLRGATVLYNTYWIRFPHGQETYDEAVRNTRTLIQSARDAGVRRIVHISITNPSEDSNLPYFKGKAETENAVKESGMSYAILRPAVVFGDKGILINNIAWFLRRFPVFVVPGHGEYRLQPVFVEDLSDLAAQKGAADENVILDAVGPEIFTFNALLDLIGDAIGHQARIIHASPNLAFLATRVLGHFVGDIILTSDEVSGLMTNLLVSDAPPTCRTRLSEWLSQNAHWIGTEYMSELKKHYT